MATIYRATDAGAPTLDGLAGSLLAVLSACLVDGYGAKAAAGWTKPFTGTDKAVFKQGGVGGLHLRIDDSAGQAASMRGYEAMSDVDTGTDPFPTVAQMASGLFIYKSQTASAVVRDWIVGADERTFWIYISYSTAVGVFTSTANTLCYFGDVQGADLSDDWAVYIVGGTSNASNAHTFGNISTIASSALSGNYWARDYLGVTKSVAGARCTNGMMKASSSSRLGMGGVAYPAPYDGALHLMPIWCTQGSTPTYILRGKIKGIWDTASISPGTPGDTVEGTGSLAGRTFQHIAVGSASSAAPCFIEISDTWD